MKASDLAVTLLILFISFPALTSAQDAVGGHWEGRMIRAGAELTVSFDFKSQPPALTGLFNSPTLRAVGIPLRNMTYTTPDVHFLLTGDVTTTIFDGEVSGDKINGQFREGAGRGGQFREGDDRGGVFREGTARGTFVLQRVQAMPPAFTEEEVIFKNNDVSLSGTLLLPKTKGPHAAIEFLHGSGAEGRQATRFFAEYFAGHGIAALISDKRGVGKSTGDWQHADFNDLAADAIAGIRFLQQRQDIDPQKIGIYGHSQGGMIAPLVASRSRDVAFVISGAGHAVPLYEGEINSITNQIHARGVQGKDLEEATDFIKMWVNVARTGQGWPEFDAAIAKARDKRWFSAMRVPPKDDWTWPFFKSTYEYNAADYWQKVTVPVLVMYGQNDLYTPVAQSIINIDHALEKAGNKDYSVIMFPRATHTFNIDLGPDQPFEWPRMAPGFPDVVLAWLHERLE
jgi:pimeloyl-ACP methyl ester carboxylesterase